jgi:hypothetical protein
MISKMGGHILLFVVSIEWQTCEFSDMPKNSNHQVFKEMAAIYRGQTLFYKAHQRTLQVIPNKKPCLEQVHHYFKKICSTL